MTEYNDDSRGPTAADSKTGIIVIEPGEAVVVRVSEERGVSSG